MKNYLGEFPVDQDQEGSPYYGFTPQDWAMEWLESYSQIDGSHHKAWVLDQVTRILKGTRVIVKVTKWENPPTRAISMEYRLNLEEPSQEYLDFVANYENDGEYSWDTGCAP